MRRGPAALLSPLGIVATTVVVDLIGFGIVLPLLPLWALRFGASPIEIGLITATYAVAQFAFAPVWGVLSDRYGRRPVILVALAGTASASLLIGLAGALWLIWVARALQGAAGASYVAAQAYVADVTPPAQRARAMGLIGAAFGVGFVLGPAIGAVTALAGPSVPFFVAAGLAGANLLLASRRLPESRPPGPAVARTGRLTELRAALGRREGAVVLALGFLGTVAFVAMESTFALLGEARFGYDETQVALLFVYIGVIAAVAQGALVGPLARRFGERSLLLAGMGATGAGLVGMALAQNLAALLAPLALVAAASGLAFAGLTALTSLRAGEAVQGGVLGALASSGSLARMAGPAIATVLFQHVGTGAPLLLGGALFAGCVALAAVGLGAGARGRAPASSRGTTDPELTPMAHEDP